MTAEEERSPALRALLYEWQATETALRLAAAREEAAERQIWATAADAWDGRFVAWRRERRGWLARAVDLFQQAAAVASHIDDPERANDIQGAAYRMEAELARLSAETLPTFRAGLRLSRKPRPRGFPCGRCAATVPETAVAVVDPFSGPVCDECAGEEWTAWRHAAVVNPGTVPGERWEA